MPISRAAREALARRFTPRVIRQAVATVDALQHAHTDLSDAPSVNNIHVLEICPPLNPCFFSLVTRHLVTGTVSYWALLIIGLALFAFSQTWKFKTPEDYQLFIVPKTPGLLSSFFIISSVLLGSSVDLYTAVKLRGEAKRQSMDEFFHPAHHWNLVFTSFVGFLNRISIALDFLFLVLLIRTHSGPLLYCALIIWTLTGMPSTFWSQARAILALWNAHHCQQPSVFSWFGWDRPQRIFFLKPSPPPFDWTGDAVLAESSAPLSDLSMAHTRAITPDRGSVDVTQLVQSAGACDFLAVRGVLLDMFLRFPSREVVAYSFSNQTTVKCLAFDMVGLPLKMFYLGSFGDNELVFWSFWMSIFSGWLSCLVATAQDGSDREEEVVPAV